jgi:hypothetical protein
VTAGCVLAVSGGTAFAAETGALPDGMQQHAHDLFSALGVPAPAPSDAHGKGSPRAGGRRTPTAVPSTRTPAPSATSALELCRAWDAAQKDPHGKAMAADRVRALLEAAGSDRGVPAFCADVLARAAGGASPTGVPAPGPPTPTHPGNGNGNGNGNGKGRPSPSPDH